MKFGVLNALQRLTTDSSPWAESAWSTKILTTNSNVVVKPTTGTAIVAQGATATNKPTIAAQDGNGNNRATYDHIGFRGGERNYEMVENWDVPQSTVSGTTNPLTGFRRWQALFGAGVTGAAIDQQDAGIIYQTPAVDITLPSNTGNVVLAMSRPVVYVQNFASYVLEAEIFVPVGLSGSWNIDIGFSSQLNSAGFAALLNASSGSSFWSVITGNPSGTGNVTTLVTSALFGVFDAGRLRLEIHGSGSPYGQCVRAYVGGQGPFVITTNVPVSELMYVILRMGSGGVAAEHVIVGQVRCFCNRYPNPDGL
jgi:hypothetical protein